LRKKLKLKIFEKQDEKRKMSKNQPQVDFMSLFGAIRAKNLGAKAKAKNVYVKSIFLPFNARNVKYHGIS